MAEPSLARLIPHAGRMCLLERIVRWDRDTLTAGTATHRDPANPLARDGRLRAIHLCEYGAQAMAVHGGLVASSQSTVPRPGMLVSLRDVELHCDFVHDLPGDLTVEARRIHDSGSAWQYGFRVTHGDTLLAQGRATVALSPP